MGTIEIKFDLPEFKDKLDISIVIKKDGEGVVSATTSSSSNLIIKDDKEIKPIEVEPKQDKSTTKKKAVNDKTIVSPDKAAVSNIPKVGGNFMNMNF